MALTEKKLREIIQDELKDTKHSCIQAEVIKYQGERIGTQDARITEIHKVVTGNGNVEEGMIYKLNKTVDFITEIKNRRKATPGNIIKWGSFVIAFGGMLIGYFSLSARQKDMQSDQKVIKAETKVTNELLAPDSTQTAITIRGPVFMPFLKTDSANIIHKAKVDSIYEKYIRSLK
jgi:hypothetical protein